MMDSVGDWYALHQLEPNNPVPFMQNSNEMGL